MGKDSLKIGRRWRWAGSAVFIFGVIFLLLTTAPIVPYHPNCGGIRKPIYLQGPLRPEYEALIQDAMTDANIFFVKWDGQIYVRYLPIFDGNDFFGGGHDFFSNFEWRQIKNLADGYSATGQSKTPPKALMDAIRAVEENYQDVSYSGRPTLSNRIYGDCLVMRAGAIEVESLRDASQVPESEH